MNAVIMTTALSPNYGASLQTFALAKVIDQLGVNVEVYTYNDKKRMTYGMSGLQKLKYFTWGMIRKGLYGGKKEEGFDEFRNKYIPMTKDLFQNNSELRANPGDYDIYIAGSDQIWNPDFFQYDLSYFLDFVPRGKKKISYASSFAKKQFDTPLREECGKLLSDFDYISVREQSGICIVEEVSGKKAEKVLDPTLLLSKNEWSDITKNASTKSKQFNGILCYVMPGDTVVTNSIEKNAKKLQMLTGLPIMRLGIKEYDHKKYKSEETDICASPIDFIQYFINAKYIVTNSFHGTAFAINFEKQLIIPYNDSLSEKKAIHERILSFLDSVDSMSVLIPANKVIERIPERDIYRATRLLEDERSKSKRYLEHSIKGESYD